MSDAISTPNEWRMQFYQHNDIFGQPPPSGGFTDATAVTTTANSSDTQLLSGGNSSCKTVGHGQGQSSPKGVPKSIRRRSRVSKKTPTTHLNANTSNFRALVQQFTGCHRSPFALGTQNGPINLNFGHKAEDHFCNTISAPAPSKHSYNTQPSQQLMLQPPEVHHQERQELSTYQEPQCMVSSDNVSTDAFFSSIGNPRPNNWEMSDNFTADNVSLYQLSKDFFLQ